MSRAVRAPAAVAGLAALLAVVAVVAGAALPAAAATPEPGDRGVLRTALRGAQPEDVPVRFVGTFENFAGPGYDLHLVELEGPVGAHVGVASGMSGSPVYFDGELLGALSYSMGFFPKDAIGGVTPIADMLDARRAAGPAATAGSAASSAAASAAAGTGGRSPSRSMRRGSIRRSAPGSRPASPSSGRGWRPAPRPRAPAPARRRMPRRSSRGRRSASG